MALSLFLLAGTAFAGLVADVAFSGVVAHKGLHAVINRTEKRMNFSRSVIEGGIFISPYSVGAAHTHSQQKVTGLLGDYTQQAVKNLHFLAVCSVAC